jgi:hypothetical protein
MSLRSSFATQYPEIPFLPRLHSGSAIFRGGSPLARIAGGTPDARPRSTAPASLSTDRLETIFVIVSRGSHLAAVLGMQILLPQTPPEVSVALAWRDLYSAGAFGQRELVS